MPLLTETMDTQVMDLSGMMKINDKMNICIATKVNIRFQVPGW